MLIGIDGNEANVNERVGSNVYAQRLLFGLSNLAVSDSFRVYLKNKTVSDLPPENSSWQYRVIKPGKLWTQWRLPLDLYLDSNPPNVFFTPGHYAPRFSPIPSVISIMDLAFLKFPETYQTRVLHQLKSWTKYSVNQAAHILAISEATKADLIEYYSLPPDKITVTHLGGNGVSEEQITPAQTKDCLKKLNISTPYFIYVGTRQPRKNLARLIEAFLSLHATERNISLVIVGKIWHQFKDQDLPTHPNIIYTGFQSAQDLNILMQASLALVFPSLYEGFGLPVLEAMEQGVLVTASNISSIPEITGQTPLLFDPNKTISITKKLKEILVLNTDAKKKLIRQAKVRATQFTWEKCTQITYQVLSQVAQRASKA